MNNEPGVSRWGLREEQIYASPDKWKESEMNLHPTVEQRFQKIEEDIDAIKTLIVPAFMESYTQMKQELEALKLKLVPEATPDFTKEELRFNQGAITSLTQQEIDLAKES